MFSALIFDSSVEAGTPRRAAAPNGPDTRPLLSVSAASMASFSWVASVPVERPAIEGVRIAHDHGPLDDVLQLPDVARPVVRLQQLRRLLGEAADPLAGAFGVAM